MTIDITKIKKQSGFTIVELLIVVVVIAILASITIVSYNGIQNRAKAASQATDINTIKKKFEAYRIFNTGYPPSSSTDLTSLELGTLRNKIDTAPSGSMDCYETIPMTSKDKYCIILDSYNYVLLWIDSSTGVWKYIYTNVNGSTYGGDLGNGVRPEAWAN